jgi:hypothetical protein
VGTGLEGKEQPAGMMLEKHDQRKGTREKPQHEDIPGTVKQKREPESAKEKDEPQTLKEKEKPQTPKETGDD